MPKSLTQLTVFISGPNDTVAEKSALRRVVEELTRRLEKTHNLTLRALGWPEDVRPGINTDAQAEVNRQIGSDYDIYVGILGPRFGTPTPRAGSGTAEELELAVDSFRAKPSSLRVLLYFKRAVGDPFAMDLEQLTKVKLSSILRLGPLRSLDLAHLDVDIVPHFTAVGLAAPAGVKPGDAR